MRRIELRVVAWALALAALSTGCRRKDKTYESVVQLVRYDAPETGDDGKPLYADVELEWDPCPGDQIEVVRGDAAFAACMAKHELGEMLVAEVRTAWDARGFYRWDITKVADCDRPPQAGDTASFEKIQECGDVTLHGQKAGYRCLRKPYADLIKICPWMRRD
ncbi:MAG: hypothetical protein IT374_05245 [Polyangiaceae bacterium]|nr:hypothetical protein [Polyangiaceae bacterium]